MTCAGTLLEIAGVRMMCRLIRTTYMGILADDYPKGMDWNEWLELVDRKNKSLESDGSSRRPHRTIKPIQSGTKSYLLMIMDDPPKKISPPSSATDVLQEQDLVLVSYCYAIFPPLKSLSLNRSNLTKEIPGTQ
jgi:hypothetical protein